MALELKGHTKGRKAAMQVTIPTLRTERLDLVPPHYSHLATYEALYGSPEVMRHIAEPIDKQAAARLLAAHAGSWVLHGFGGWCVEERATRAVIGIAGLKRLEQGEDVEVGWIIEPSAWGRGYATEAAREVIQYAFEQIGALRAVAHIAPENAGSIAVARKLGMQLEQEAAVGTALVFVRNRELALEAYPHCQDPTLPENRPCSTTNSSRPTSHRIGPN